MATNWGAIIAGLAGGASSLGQSMSDREKAALAAHQQKLQNDSALLHMIDEYGLEPTSSGQSSSDILKGDMVSKLNQMAPPGIQMAGGGSSLMPQITGPSYTEQRDQQIGAPQARQNPSVVTLGDSQYLRNPMQGAAARAVQAKANQSAVDLAMKALYDKQNDERTYKRELDIKKYEIANRPPERPFIVPTAEGVNLTDTKGQTIRRLGSPVVPPVNSTMTVQAGTEGKPAQAVIFNPRAATVKTEALPDVSKGTSIGKGLNAQSAAQVARTFGGLAEMDNGRQFMDKYEADLDRGFDDNGKPVSLEGVAPVLKQMLGGLGTDVAHPVLGVPAYAALATADPRLARYLRYGMTFGEGEGLIANRPSDFRQKISQFLSTARAGMGPGSYNDIKSRRDVITEAVKAAMTSAVPEAASAVSGAIDKVHSQDPTRNNRVAPTEKQAAWDAAVAKYGEAKVLQEFGPRPK